MGPRARRGFKAGLRHRSTVRWPAAYKTELQAFKDKLERLVNLAIQLVNDGIPQDQLVARLETKNGGLHLSLASKEPDRFYAEIPPSKRLSDGK